VCNAARGAQEAVEVLALRKLGGLLPLAKGVLSSSAAVAAARARACLGLLGGGS
jgi:hypothetical protein